MGGSVTILIRFSDGELLGKSTYTNSFYKKCSLLGFQSEDRNYINSIFSSHDHDMLVPDSYGFTYFDFIERKIIDLQDYTDPTQIALTGYYLGRYTDKDIVQLVNNDYIKFIEFNDKEYTNVKKGNSVSEIMEHTTNVPFKYNVLSRSNFHLDWNYHNINNISSDDEIKSHMKSLYKEMFLSNYEKSQYEEFLKEYFEF